MVSTKIIAALAVSAFAASVQAQIPTGILASNISTECSTALTSGLTSALVPCDLADLAAATANTSAIAKSLLSSSKFLDSYCSSSCTTALGSFNTAATACGSNPVLGSTFDGTVLAGLTVPQIQSIITWNRGVACLKDGSNFCLVQQFAQFKTDFPNLNPNSIQTVLSDRSLVCTTCTKNEIDALSANQTGIPSNLVSMVNSYASSLKSAQSNCTSLTGSASSQSSDSSSLRATSFGLVATIVSIAAFIL